MGLFSQRLQESGLSRLDNCNNSQRSSSRKFIKTNQAPYQAIGQRTLAASLGYKELSCPKFWLSVLSELLSCYLYVFVVCSTRISWTGAVIGHEPNLIAMALSSGIAMMLLILTFRTVHVNPALTISFLLTGRIPVIRAFMYIFVHCLGAIAAVAFLYSISVKGHAGALGLDNPHYNLESWQVLIVELVISFVVTLATYATCNYSSYTNARRFILEQVGQQNSDLLSQPNNSNIDSDNIFNRRSANHVPSKILTTNTEPRRPMTQNNFRVHPQNKGYFADSYTEDTSEYDYEYDNHRIFATQQPSFIPSPDNRLPLIEEVMQDECSLLAPNGFAIHVTNGQAFVIGIAYTVASLSGIPASGASLNPARSLGPAFIMNRWDRHWIYWIGPILGAVVAGLFYEFIFSPTRRTSLCYLPKLFHLSAHDMAKVGTKSRLYQQQQQQHQHQQKLSPMIAANTPIFSSAPTYRTQLSQHLATMHLSPTTDNMLTNPSMLNQSTREQPQQLNASSASHLQSTHFPTVSNDLDPISYINQHQSQQQTYQNQQHQYYDQQIAGFDDRSKSSAMINFIANKQQQQQNTMNLPQRNGNFHSNSASNASGSTNADFDGLKSRLPETTFGDDKPNFYSNDNQGALFTTNGPSRLKGCRPKSQNITSQTLIATNNHFTHNAIQMIAGNSYALNGHNLESLRRNNNFNQRPKSIVMETGDDFATPSFLENPVSQAIRPFRVANDLANFNQHVDDVAVYQEPEQETNGEDVISYTNGQLMAN